MVLVEDGMSRATVQPGQSVYSNHLRKEGVFFLSFSITEYQLISLFCFVVSGFSCMLTGTRMIKKPKRKPK